MNITLPNVICLYAPHELRIDKAKPDSCQALRSLRPSVNMIVAQNDSKSVHSCPPDRIPLTEDQFIQLEIECFSRPIINSELEANQSDLQLRPEFKVGGCNDSFTKRTFLSCSSKNSNSPNCTINRAILPASRVHQETGIRLLSSRDATCINDIIPISGRKKEPNSVTLSGLKRRLPESKSTPQSFDSLLRASHTQRLSSYGLGHLLNQSSDSVMTSPLTRTLGSLCRKAFLQTNILDHSPVAAGSKSCELSNFFDTSDIQCSKDTNASRQLNSHSYNSIQFLNSDRSSIIQLCQSNEIFQSMLNDVLVHDGDMDARRRG
ncbi:unnamed protein product [Protopolystoma xenopodis]|uniref:Uncharacterized protein n=1 Tax=Protopolystoma xenopodis TaxID=117903 RepID=A0A3S5ALY5_9PLAT|nr:unnamed protein product [Protopolystoma xenopodis]